MVQPASNTASSPALLPKTGDARNRTGIAGYTKHWNADSTKDSAQQMDARKHSYTDVVNGYYDGATELYEFGWGLCFHFARYYKGESFFQAIARHEHYLSAQMGLKPGMHVLDVGCGVGGPAREIARFSGATITGVNNNQFQVDRAKKYTARAGLSNQVKYVKGDFMGLAELFGENSFDAVYAIEATVHAPNFEAIYKEIRKVLKPGGTFGVYEWCMTNRYDASIPAHRKIAHGIEIGDGIPEMRNIQSARDALQAVGFEINHDEDLAERPDEITWYYPLEGDIRKVQTLWDVLMVARMTWLGKILTQNFVYIGEKLGMFPKGTYDVGETLKVAANCLVAGGRAKLFTPMPDLADDPLVQEYGQNNIRLSRTYEGTGARIRRVLQKALRGEAIKIAVVGGSVSAGHGVPVPTTPNNFIFTRILQWFLDTFPDATHELNMDAAIPATTAFYFSYCVLEHIPEDVDLVLMELDINHHDPHEASLKATEALYRTILEMPQKPAIIYLSIFALMFQDMTHGWRHSALISQWFDVPEINIRNFLIPQILKHPEDIPHWYLNWEDLLDTRHINQYGHKTMADMVIGYLREQLCLLQRDGPFELEATTNPSVPTNEIAGSVPRLGMLAPYDEKKALPLLKPFCKSIVSVKNPLYPVRTEGWEAVSRNDKRSYEATVPGSEITFRFPVQDGLVGFYFWRTKDESFGAVDCNIDSDTRPERMRRVVAYDPHWGANIFEHTSELWSDISPGEHEVTCRLIAGPKDGTIFRISAVVTR
ncbi:MAG: Delta(24)-sterol C-methyltransferase [Cyphobasidiales sp. Tagirdzhanova-0007]|nr:MAG: Delta(24)-sterol C-methyltransferase [Cyphobasidiales sp. Tagirdzhanova-0007]